MNTMIETLLKEFDNEANTTRKMLSRIPDDSYDWKPHAKSMTIRQLAVHIAELPTWIGMTLFTDELDFASAPYQPASVNNTAELLAYFEKSLAEGRNTLAAATDEQLQPIWTMRTGDQIHLAVTKGEMIRITFSQIVHHRAQLGVYLRLLNIPIPGSYGPSADELEMAF
ncbi:DinB family protein [Mucilaginibacter sp. Bleaf8]|uniref:DinB family protein n=1 Tax=Mucilaginibacter sp. Bleaf8 TaxID=2834430 RepID=UPI001BCC7245|nr:DinB family protein [Mucilaginibacter sp. Bleaf8]MBS7564971.1 DinB family protein [Mucilaginibacter sp. Bleaf8]